MRSCRQIWGKHYLAIAEPFGPPTWPAALATALQAVMGAVGALQPHALSLPAFPLSHLVLQVLQSNSSTSPGPLAARATLVTMNTHIHMTPKSGKCR